MAQARSDESFSEESLGEAKGGANGAPWGTSTISGGPSTALQAPNICCTRHKRVGSIAVAQVESGNPLLCNDETRSRKSKRATPGDQAHKLTGACQGRHQRATNKRKPSQCHFIELPLSIHRLGSCCKGSEAAHGSMHSQSVNAYQWDRHADEDPRTTMGRPCKHVGKGAKGSESQMVAGMGGAKAKEWPDCIALPEAHFWASVDQARGGSVDVRSGSHPGKANGEYKRTGSTKVG
jgi:hypothetical protein